MENKDKTEMLEKNFEEILIVLDSIKEQLMLQRQDQKEQFTKIIGELDSIERNTNRD